MASPRRVGAETSKTRDTLLDCVERLMIEKGYAAVTYRAAAAEAGVTSGLVQYYFPTLDDLFLATIRRRAEQNEVRLREALADHADRPLHVLWEFSRHEVTAALTIELTALGNHRKSIRSEIAKAGRRTRQIQLDALAASSGDDLPGPGDLPQSVLLFLLTGIPKLLRLEKGVGLTTAHTDVIATFEHYLDEIEPPPTASTRRRSPKRPKLLGP